MILNPGAVNNTSLVIERINQATEAEYNDFKWVRRYDRKFKDAFRRLKESGELDRIVG